MLKYHNVSNGFPHREDVIATAGATQGLHLLSHLLFSPGDIVFVENPTFFLANTIFESDAGLRLIGGKLVHNSLMLLESIFLVPLDERGLIPEELEKLIEANKHHRPRELSEKKPFWAMLYSLATFQNPCGMCLPPGQSTHYPTTSETVAKANFFVVDRCRRVIKIARKHNILVVTDDVYNLICHKPPPRLFSFDTKYRNVATTMLSEKCWRLQNLCNGQAKSFRY